MAGLKRFQAPRPSGLVIASKPPGALVSGRQRHPMCMRECGEGGDLARGGCVAWCSRPSGEAWELYTEPTREMWAQGHKDMLPGRPMTAFAWRQRGQGTARGYVHSFAANWQRRC